MRMLITIMFAVAGLGIIIGVILPLYSSIQVLQNDLSERKNVLGQIESVLKQQDDLLTKYNTISEEDFLKLERAIPVSSERDQLLLQIEKYANSSGLEFSTISFAVQPGGKEMLGTVTTRVRVSGSYDSFRNFLVSIENMLRIIDIQSVSFSGGNVDEYSFDVSMQSYYLDK